MKRKLLTSLILTSLWAIGEPVLLRAEALQSVHQNADSLATNGQLMAKPTRSGGSRPSGGSRDISRPSHEGGSGGGSRTALQKERNSSNRINRDNVGNRPQNLNRDQVNNRVHNTNLDRDDVRNRVQNTNVDRDNVRNRVDQNNLNLDNDRNYSNRVNHNNIGNDVRIGNRNVVVNPRGSRYGGWGWNQGVAWRPVDTYWGGGFWGPFAAGTVTGLVTGAAINELANDNKPTYVIVQQNTPGYRLLSDYGLTQTQCGNGVVVINGPENSVICATPNSTVRAGTYYIDTESLTLIPQ